MNVKQWRYQYDKMFTILPGMMLIDYESEVKNLTEENRFLRTELYSILHIIESKHNSIDMPSEIYSMLTDVTMSIEGTIREFSE